MATRKKIIFQWCLWNYSQRGPAIRPIRRDLAGIGNGKWDFCQEVGDRWTWHRGCRPDTAAYLSWQQCGQVALAWRQGKSRSGAFAALPLSRLAINRQTGTLTTINTSLQLHYSRENNKTPVPWNITFYSKKKMYKNTWEFADFPI